jgi:hypothetical protein
MGRDRPCRTARVRGREPLRGASVRAARCGRPGFRVARTAPRGPLADRTLRASAIIVLFERRIGKDVDHVLERGPDPVIPWPRPCHPVGLTLSSCGCDPVILRPDPVILRPRSCDPAVRPYHPVARPRHPERSEGSRVVACPPHRGCGSTPDSPGVARIGPLRPTRRGRGIGPFLSTERVNPGRGRDSWFLRGILPFVQVVSG